MTRSTGYEFTFDELTAVYDVCVRKEMKCVDCPFNHTKNEYDPNGGAKYESCIPRVLVNSKNSSEEWESYSYVYTLYDDRLTEREKTTMKKWQKSGIRHREWFDGGRKQKDYKK